MFIFGSQHLEIFFLPAVPTERLDRKWQPQIPMTLRTVMTYCKGLRMVQFSLRGPRHVAEGVQWKLQLIIKIHIKTDMETVGTTS